MKTIKLCLSILFVIFVTNYSLGIDIPIYGKAGAHYQNGQWKICPGFTFYKCASITITWEDVKNFFLNNCPDPPKVIVTIYEPDGTESILYLELIHIDHVEESPPAQLYGDNLILK